MRPAARRRDGSASPGTGFLTAGLLAGALMATGILADPRPVWAQEIPVEGCTFDATVTGFFQGEFEGRAWIGSVKGRGGSLDQEEARRLHLCVGSRSSGFGCADPEGPKLFDMSLPLPEPGETGGYARETVLYVGDRDVFRSNLVDRWSTVDGPGTLQVAVHEAGRQILEHEMAALGRTYVDTVYTPSVGGSFQASLVPAWREIRPEGKMAWLEDGQTYEADPKIQVNVSFNAGVLKADPTAAFGSEPSLQCVAARPFGIIARTPDAGHRNIDFGNAVVDVTFTAGLDPASVTAETFQVGHLDPEGTFVPAPGELRIRSGGRVVRFDPDQPLKDAVYYRVRVRGGPAGVRGGDDEHLPSDAEWRFATAPDLSGEDGASGSVELHVYQVSRDAKLVPGKPSVLRVYGEWTADPDVHPDEQVERAPAKISVADGAGTRLFANEDFEFVRPDRYEEYAVRTKDAEHTANLFGWEPSRGDGSPLEATVAFRSDATADELDFTAVREVEYWRHSPDFVFDHYFLEIGPWADGVPRERRASGGLAAERAAEFTRQNFPVVEVRSRNGGAYDLGLDLTAEGEDAVWETIATIHDMKDDVLTADDDGVRIENLQNYRSNRLSSLLWLFNDAVAPHTDAQVLVAFTPLEYTGIAAGGSHLDELLERIEKGHDHYPARLVHMPVRTDIYLANLLTHEFGHAFGLEHLPYVDDVADREEECSSGRRRMAGIEGFRIAPDGRRGWNKSFEEGNAESDRTLLPLMYPCGQRKTEAFVAEDHYRQLLSSLESAIRSGTYWMAGAPVVHGHRAALALGRSDRSERIGGSGPGSRPEAGRRGPNAGGEWPSGGTRDRAAGDARDHWMISGIVRGDDGAAGFAPLRRMERPGGADATPSLSGAGASSPSGLDVAPYTVELLDSSGRTLHAGAVDPRGPSGEDAWRHFRTVLPAGPEAARVVLKHEGRVIGERRRSPNGPTLVVRNREETTAATDGVTLRWEGTDPDGDDLIYAVLYSADGEFPWRVLSAPRLAPSMEVDLRQLPQGEEPTLRVIARDGFHETDVRVPVNASGEPAGAAALEPESTDAGAAVVITGPLQAVFGASGSGPVALQGTCIPGGPTILRARLGEGDGSWIMMNTIASLGSAGPGSYEVPTLQLALADGPGAGIYQGSGELRIEGSGSARRARLTATLPPASGGAPVTLGLAFSPAKACGG